MQNELVELNDQGFLCCGINEISGISEGSAEEVVLDLLTNNYDYDYEKNENILELDIPEYSHLIFTQASSRTPRGTGYGFRLESYIAQEGLGDVVHSAPAKNPKTDNYIVVFTWTLDRKGIQRWAKKNNIAS